LITYILSDNNRIMLVEKRNDYNAIDQTKRRYIRDLYVKKAWGWVK